MSRTLSLSSGLLILALSGPPARGAPVPLGARPAEQPGEPDELGPVAVALEAQVAALRDLLRHAREQPLRAEHLTAIVGPGSACTDLLPTAGPARAAGELELGRATGLPAPPAHRGRDDLAAELNRLVASFPGGPDAGALAVDAELAGLVEASDGWVAELACSLRSASREVSARWATRWRLPPHRQGPPQLVYLELLEFASATARAPAAPPRFSDVTARVLGAQPAWRDDLARGLDELNSGLQRELHAGWAGHRGLAVADVDGDGRDDLFVCQPGGLPNRLFLQQPDGSALDAAGRLRLDLLDSTAAALWLDLDGDGDQDLVSSIEGAVLVHENRDFQGSPRFGLRAALLAFGPASLAAADYDLDGDLDLFAAGTDAAFDVERLPEPLDDALNGRPSRLFQTRIEGERWEFTDVTAQAGLGELRGFVSAASFEDHDRDGDPDLFVADAFGPLRLFRNDSGRFRDATRAAGLEGLAHVHSLAWSDVDSDGREELCAAAPASAGGLVWLDPRGDGSFARSAGLDGGHAFGAAALDLQNDGWTDLVSVGGFALGTGGAGPRGQAGRAWLGAGAALGYVPAAGPLGLDARGEGRALAALDWNRDGALDLVQTARGAPRLRLLLNDGRGGERALAVRLVGEGPNRDAVGARVELELATGTRAATLRAGGGFLAQSSQWLHFVLRDPGDVRRATVHWPDGASEVFEDLAPGRWLLVRGSARAAAPASSPGPVRPPPAPSSTAAAPGQPEPALLLAAPVALPALPVVDADGAETSLGGKGPRARLVVLPAPSAAAVSAALVAARAELEHLGLEVVALVDAFAPGDPASWPFTRVVPRGETLAALDLVARLSSETRASPGRAAALLIDSSGRLRAVYPGPPAAALDLALVVAHARLLDASPEALRDAAVPFPGRWHAAAPRADLRWLAARFRDAGLVDSAAELRLLDYETLELTRESMMTETALVRIRQGQLEEAVRHLRGAIELAPDWAPPLAHLGRVLLALDRPAEAVLPFERALELRPLDALALAGLARAYADLGEAGAARDLARYGALRDPARGPALVAEVEQRLTAGADLERAPGPDGDSR